MIRSCHEGHRHGGPLFLLVALLIATAGCGGAPGEPTPERGADGIARPLEIYRQLGMITGSEDYPAVASFATMAGPSDSTYVLFGLSLPNSALRFQREGDGFVGRYDVALAFLRDSQAVRRFERTETVRIGSFSETGRTEESIVFQETLAVPPGEYVVEIDVRDQRSERRLQTRDTIDVPAYGTAAQRLSPPVVTYEARGRASRGDRLDLIVNPRHTVQYGTPDPRLYLESYGGAAEQSVRLRVVDERGDEHWTRTVPLEAGTAGLRHATIDLPTGSLPLGRLWVEVSAGSDTTTVHRSPLLVTISDQWMVANFDQVLDFLSFIATADELDELREATGSERQARWEEFWQRRDPVPATPTNEFRDAFFERVRLAATLFGEPGYDGWETDRGEVFIVLGRPARVLERRIGRTQTAGQPNAIQWLYEDAAGGRLELMFLDRRGFGHYRLTPSSESRFRAAAQRLKRE